MNEILLHNLQAWQTFYVMLGTASATLLGLLFVALTLGSGEIYQERTRVVFRIFVTPVYHQFLTVLIIALLLFIPTQTPFTLAFSLLLVFLYNSRIHFNTTRITYTYSHLVTTRNKISNIFLPVICTFTIIISAALLIYSLSLALTLLAFSSSVLLLLGISNTWTIMTWIMEQKNKEIDEKRVKRSISP